jgi:hypothetical protein
LYERYPENFPHGISDPTVAHDAQSRFRFDRIRIVRVIVPDGSGTGIAYRWPGDSGDLKVELSGVPARERRLVVGIEVQGAMQSRLPVGLAANGIVRIPRVEEPLVALKVTSAESFAAFLPAAAQMLDMDTVGEIEIVKRARFFYWKITDGNRAFMTRELPGDGESNGELELTPSREVARDIHLDPYVATALTYPLAVEIVSVPGHWVD